jgi:thioredoxin-related protein
MIFCSVISAQTRVNWMSIEEAVKMQESSPRTILIDMYTDWCGWCKKMDMETFNNPDIANYINTNFYPVKFNAETKDTVVYRGETFINMNTGQRSSHQLAQMLMGGRMSYPTIVYIDYEFKVNPVPGFMDIRSIEPILVYFAERINKNSDYAYFLKDFRNAFEPDSTSKVDGNVNWLTLEGATELMKNKKDGKPKKMMLFVNSDFNNSSKIMLASSFRHPVISDYINSNFYPVKINYDTPDTVKFNEGIFINEQNVPGYPNQFTIALLQPDIRLPSIVFIDEEFRLIFALRGYFPPETLERYMDFISKDLYINGTDWIKFNEEFESKLE